MKKAIKLLGATVLLAAIVPLSAYAATSVTAPTDKAAPAAAVAAPSEQNDVETADDAATAGTVEQSGAEAPEAAKTPEAVDPNEQAKLAQAATVTKQQAIDTALKQVSGTVKDASLEDENGVIVYNVQIIDANGKKSEIKVDAKTGSIATSDADHNDGGNDGETNDDN